MGDKFSAERLRDSEIRSERLLGLAAQIRGDSLWNRDAEDVAFGAVAITQLAELRARITALQAQLAEARGRVIEECVREVQESHHALLQEFPQERFPAEARATDRAVAAIRALAQREPSEAKEGGTDAP